MKLFNPRYSLISLLVNIVSKKYSKLSYCWIPITSIFIILIVYFLTLNNVENLTNSVTTASKKLQSEKELEITTQLINETKDEIIFVTPSEIISNITDNNDDISNKTSKTEETSSINTTNENEDVTTSASPEIKIPKYYCYATPEKLNENIDYLENIQTATIQPQKNGQNIFFHETTCITDGLVKLKSRQACSIESAAKTNPKMLIFILFTAMVGFERNKTKDSIISALEKYPNIYFRNVDIWSYINGTIPEAEKFINTGIMFQSPYVHVHTADFLRILSLYRYGGSYFDLDFIVKKDLSEILPNYLGEELPNEINNGFMNFAPDGMGHHVVQECLLEFATTYEKDKWGYNGPMLLTRIIKRLCKVERVTLCPWFRVFEPKAFCPIYYGKLELLFDTKFLTEAIEVTKDAIAIHCWNALTYEKKVKVGTNVGYGKFAEEYCPNVYGSCGEYF